MTWEIFVVKFKGNFASVNAAGEDEHLLDLGTLAEVRAAITASFPETDWSEPGWGSYKVEKDSIGFDIGMEDPVETLALHVDAEDTIVEQILDFASENGWHAAEHGDAPFLDAVGDPAAGLRASRDQD